MQLTWNEHIDTLRRKLLQRIAILEMGSEIYTSQISIASLQCKYQTAQTAKNLADSRKN